MDNDQFEIHRLPKRIIKNTLYNTAGNWIVLGLNFLIIPYVIGKLGVELYGSAWVVGILIIASAPFIDFGLGSASIKFIAEYNANQQYNKINEIVNTGIFYYAIFGVILLLIVSLFGVQLLALIGVPPNFSDEAFFVLFFSTLILILINTCSPLTSVVTSLQRMDLTNTVTVTTALLNILQTLIVLSTNLGIRGLIVGYLVVNIISISWLIFLSYRLLPQLKLKLFFVNRDALKQLWRFGINLQLSRISQIVVFQLDRIFALRFFGSASAAFYEVAVKVATLARNIPLVLTSALLPVVSEMDAKKEDQKVNILFERGSRYLIIVGMLLLGYIFIMSRLIIQTWMGKTLSQEGIDAASNVMKILVIGYFFNMTTGIASTIAAGINRTDIERNVGIISFFISPIITIILIYSIGYYGIPTSTMLMLTIGAVYYTVQFVKIIEKDIIYFYKMFLKPALGFIIAITVNISIQYFTNLTDVHSRIEGIIVLGIYFIIFSASYILSIFMLGVFDEYDRSILDAVMKKLRLKSG